MPVILPESVNLVPRTHVSQYRTACYPSSDTKEDVRFPRVDLIQAHASSQIKYNKNKGVIILLSCDHYMSLFSYKPTWNATLCYVEEFKMNQKYKCAV